MGGLTCLVRASAGACLLDVVERFPGELPGELPLQRSGEIVRGYGTSVALAIQHRKPPGRDALATFLRESFVLPEQLDRLLAIGEVDAPVLVSAHAEARQVGWSPIRPG